MIKKTAAVPPSTPSPADLVEPLRLLLKLLACLERKKEGKSDEHAVVLLRNIVKHSRFMVTRARKRWLHLTHQIPPLQAAFAEIYQRVRNGLSLHEEREQIRTLLVDERLMPSLEQKGRDYAEWMVTRLTLDDATIRTPEKGGPVQRAEWAVQILLSVSATSQRAFDGDSMKKAFRAPFAFGVSVSDLEVVECALRILDWCDADFDYLGRMPTRHLPRDGELHAFILHCSRQDREPLRSAPPAPPAPRRRSKASGRSAR